MVETTERFPDKRTTGLTRSEVAEKLKPVISLHNIEVKDDRIEFPGVYPSTDVPESELSDDTKTTIILYPLAELII